MAIQQETNGKLREIALFAGAGGGILGGKLLGWHTVCAVEWDAYAASILVARQNDECLCPFPVWDDIQTFDGRPWRGRVDVVSGGFPCQDISAAGKGAGIEGERSGMWKHMARIVGEVRPRFVVVENSPRLVGRGLAVVLGDLASMGYDARWGIVGAHHVSAPHSRDRIWIVAEMAHTMCKRGASRVSEPFQGEKRNTEKPNNDCHRLGIKQVSECNSRNSWEAEPSVGRVAYGVAHRVDRLKAIGNGQVPQCAAMAFRLLTSNLPQP